MPSQELIDQYLNSDELGLLIQMLTDSRVSIDDIVRWITSFNPRQVNIVRGLLGNYDVLSVNNIDDIVTKAADIDANGYALHNMTNAIERIANSEGRITNPHMIDTLLGFIQPGGGSGHAQALEDASQRVAQGHTVQLEVGADVVDETTQEALQHKEITADDQQVPETRLGSFDNQLISGLRQLTGSGNENIPVGFQPILDIRITNPNHRYYDYNQAQFVQVIRENMAGGIRLSRLDNLLNRIEMTQLFVDITAGVDNSVFRVIYTLNSGWN